MIIACHHISKSFPEKTVLSDVTFHLEKGEKAAVVGINGAGKSTLLRIIVGEMEPDDGTVTFARDTTFGYLAQVQDLHSEHTIREELTEVKRDVLDMEEKLSEQERLMEELSGDALEQLMESYHALRREYDRRSGYAVRGEITGIMNGLGFTEEEREQRISTLSGGQRTRVALGKLLLLRPDIILLDEPTNHLDIESIRWLENWIIGYRGTVILVSHDRYFLDRTVSKVIEVENAGIQVFEGNYSVYADRKAALIEEQRRAYLNNQAEIRHQEEVIAKLRQFNREKSIKRAESREKMLSRIERVEKPFSIRADMRLTFTPRLKSGRDVMHVEGLSRSFDGRLLFENVGFDIRRGEHVALIGSNGTGKTTILKILNGLLPPDTGIVRLGTNVIPGYYDQEQQVLDDENTVFEELSDAHPAMNNTEIRSLLAAFLFTGEDVFKRVGDLSGGERGRLSLCKLMLSHANLLILDEPTNHLDMISKEVLEKALNGYEGTLLYVSHDRYFINHTASRILVLSDRKLADYAASTAGEDDPDRFTGNYDYYLEKSAEEAADAAQSSGAGMTVSAAGPSSHPGNAAGASAGAAGMSTETSAADWKAQKDRQARMRKAAADLRRCEERIAALEARSAALQEELTLPEVCADPVRLQELSTELSDIQAQLDDRYREWDELAQAEGAEI